MKHWKKIAMALLGIAVVLQFIRPEKNLSNDSTHNISRQFAIPPAVRSVLQRSCFDCHSNHTVYPWYAEIEPGGWYLAGHIRDGKRALNFDEYTTYRPIKQYHRFNDIIDQIQGDEMPLPSYLLIHRYAKLSSSEKNDIVEWCTAMRDTMKATFPIDSLVRRPQR